MSLTQTAYTSRQLIKYGGTGIVVFVILWGLVTTAYQAYLKFNPPYVKPTVKYGLIPQTVFPEKAFTKKDFSFEFANDKTPDFSDQAKVYVIYRSNNTFLALSDDIETAKNMGFSNAPKEINSGVYEFRDDTSNKTLTVNVLTGSFKVSYPYLSDQLLLDPKDMPTKDEAISKASSFLKNAGKFSEDLEDGEKKVSYWQIENDGLKSVGSIAEASLIRVDFYRKDLDDLKIFSTENNQASVSILVSGSDVETKRIVEVNFKDVNIDRESFSTYPIKTVSRAMEQLKSGDYWPVSDSKANSVTIRKISLAYFEPTTLTNYIQPVFVFEGDDGFMAYVPAVAEKCLEGTNSSASKCSE